MRTDTRTETKLILTNVIAKALPDSDNAPDDDDASQCDADNGSREDSASDGQESEEDEIIDEASKVELNKVIDQESQRYG